MLPIVRLYALCLLLRRDGQATEGIAQPSLLLLPIRRTLLERGVDHAVVLVEGVLEVGNARP